MTHTALIIDDEADIRELIAMSLDRIGWNTHTAANLEEARNLLDLYDYDVCLTDMRLPDGNGVDFVKHIHSKQPELPVAVITAHGNMNAAVEAMKNGAFDFVSKPMNIHLLRNLVTQAVKVHQGSTSEHSNNDSGDSQTTTHVNHSTASMSSSTADTSNDSSTPGNLYPGSSTLASTYCLPGKPANTGHVDGTSGPPGFLARHVNGQHSMTATQASRARNSQAANSEPAMSIGNGRLIGQSMPMQQLRHMIYKVARTNAPVWITGESGTGKELIARLVHEHGPRAESPFVAINCGAIPSELMESELFGHRKGSFTGAHSNQEGLFKHAEGGTLFLDEVAELPLHMQVKLLRAIQERSIRPVGSSEEISTDVRILSASHKDLAKEVDKGSFRHDLYYRLNVICIQSPSLRDRADDVPQIADHILKSIATCEGKHHYPALTQAAKTHLSQYTFPGNVRELENILERAVALTDGGLIDVDDLHIEIGELRNSKPAEPFSPSMAANDASERQLIINTLNQNRWNRKATARQLGMTYRQLRYRIQQYGIDLDETGS